MTDIGTVSQLKSDADGLYADVPEHWLQGRTVFGGLLTAIGLQACSEGVEPDRRVRSVQARFSGPAVAGRIDVDVEDGGIGRSVSHRRAVLRQAGEVCTVVDVTFGVTREKSKMRLGGPDAPDATEPGSGFPFPYIPGVTPVFTQNLQATLLDGDMPYSGSSQALIGGWCRWKGGNGGLGGTLALLDAWPPPTLALATAPHPSSTVHLTLHLIGDVPSDGSWLRLRSRGLTAGQGYCTSQAFMWNEVGELVGWMEQLYATYDS